MVIGLFLRLFITTFFHERDFLAYKQFVSLVKASSHPYYVSTTFKMLQIAELHAAQSPATLFARYVHTTCARCANA